MRGLSASPRINITLKFMGYLILVSVIPLLMVGAISYQISRRILQEEISSYTIELIHGKKNYLDLMLQEGESLIANISSVEEITNVLQDPSSDTYTNLATQARIGYILNNYSNVQGLVSIDIFTLNGTHFHVGDTLNVSNVREDVRDNLFDLVKKSNSDVLWYGIEDNINVDSDNPKVVTAAKIFTELDSVSMQPEAVALLVVNYQVDYLYDLFADLDLGKDGYLMIVDKQNRVVFHPNEALIGNHVDPSVLSNLTENQGSLILNIGGQETSVTYTHSSTSGWLIASFIPVTTLTESTSIIGRTSLVTLVICLLLVGILGTIYTRNLVYPIREITNAFRLYEEGSSQAMVHLPEQGEDEIGELVRWFNMFLDGQQARSAAEKSLREREHYLSLLNEITVTALTTADFQNMLDILARRMSELMNAERAYIFLWEKGQQIITSSVASDAEDTCQPDYAKSVELSMAEAVLEGELAWVVEDVFSSLPMSPQPGSIFHSHSMLGLPLIADGRKLGAVLIGFQERHQFSEDEINLGEQAASLISLSLARATLLEETRRFNEALEIRISERTLQLEAANRELEEERSSLSNRVAERTAELSAANSELARAVRAKDEFLANMSHELRTPLNAILGLSEALQEETYGKLTPRQIQTLDTISSSGKHLLSLINDILDLSKIEAGKLDTQFEWVDVKNICYASHQFIKQQAFKKSIQYSLSTDQSPNRFVGDERRIKQILVNLLTNAVKFTPDGGQIGLIVKPSKTGGEICFEVWDTGIGISIEDQKRLFKPFVQIDGGLSRHHEGTGLGLALVSRLAELHHGSVTLKSEPGKGSRFIVCLPLTQDYPHLEELQGTPDHPSEAVTALDGTLKASRQADPNQNSDHAVASIPSSLGAENNTQDAEDLGPLILLAEDNETNIQMISDFLMSRGYRVIVARNGIETEEIAIKELPAMILMDVQMPVRDGLEATRRIRSNLTTCEIPVIALTALAMHGDRELCLQAGANEYLTKPVRLKSLIEIVRSYVHQS